MCFCVKIKSMEEKIKKICPKCKSDNVRGHGTPNGVQRYYCKDCKKTFSETYKRTKYSLKEQNILALLLSFIENIQNEEPLDIHKIIENIESHKNNVKNFRIEQNGYDNKNHKINCCKPKLLICEENNTLTLYSIPVRHSRFSSAREIKICDNDKYSKFKKIVIPKNIQMKFQSDDDEMFDVF